MALFLLLFFSVTSCGKSKKDAEADADQEAAPTLPSDATLTMSADPLKEDADSIELSFSQGEESRGSNHLAAYLAAVAASGTMGLVLAAPAAALKAAFAQTPTRQDDGTWLWSYTFTYGGVSYTTALTGTKLSATSASFSFAVTRSPADDHGCCDKFVWLEGTTSSATAGSWTINDHTAPTTKAANLKVDWDFPQDTEKDLRVTLKKQPDAGSEWGVDGFVRSQTSGTTRTLTVDKDPGNSGALVIAWDQSTQAGSMTIEDGTKTCWDTALANVTCP